MATWVEPIDSQTDPDAPLTSELGKRWDNNVIAAFEGASGAPRLRGEAVARPGNGLPVATVSAANTFEADPDTLGFVEGASVAEAVEVVAATYTISAYTGSMRFRASHRSDDGVSMSRLSFYRNGTLVTSFNTTGNVPFERSVDSSVAAGDTIEWRHQRTSGSGDSIFSAPSVFADNPYVEQKVFIRSSNV